MLIKQHDEFAGVLYTGNNEDHSQMCRFFTQPHFSDFSEVLMEHAVDMLTAGIFTGAVAC